jgi:hypothetical protein
MSGRGHFRNGSAGLGIGLPSISHDRRGADDVITRAEHQPLDSIHRLVEYYTSSLAVKPAPPVDDVNLMRRNFAFTPVTVRASPAAFVVVSMV